MMAGRWGRAAGSGTRQAITRPCKESRRGEGQGSGRGQLTCPFMTARAKLPPASPSTFSKGDTPYLHTRSPALSACNHMHEETGTWGFLHFDQGKWRFLEYPHTTWMLGVLQSTQRMCFRILPNDMNAWSASEYSKNVFQNTPIRHKCIERFIVLGGFFKVSIQDDSMKCFRVLRERF